MTRGDKFDRLPLDVIVLEMEKLLVQEHGLAGVRVFIDRQTGAITCSHDILHRLAGMVFAFAVRCAIVKSVRDQEDLDGGQLAWL